MLPLKPPSAKKVYKKGVKLVNFPVFDDNNESIYESSLPAYHGIFNGKVVVIKDSNEKSRLASMGSYGQLGMFDEKLFIDYKTLQNQVLRRKKNWQAMELVPFEFPDNNYELHKDKSEETESSLQEELNPFEYPNNDKDESIDGADSHVRCSPSPSNWKELKTSCTKKYDELLILSGHEHSVPYFLFLEEAFFLCYTLECLEIKDESGSVISVLDCWKLFNELKTNFSFYYAAYHYYRSKGWAVKPGQQYGGDFVLYKTSPIYYHSSYVVVININEQNSELLSSWPTWFGCNRSVEAASKELLICAVHGPVYKKGTPVDLTQYTVNDIIVRRWVPFRNRESKEYKDK